MFLLISKFFCMVILYGISLVEANLCECDENIFCLYPLYNPGPACVNYERNGFGKEEKKEIVKVINEYRNKVAQGLEERGSPGPQPQAADMMEVTWDLYLHSTAQRYADQCTMEHSSGRCRKTEYFTFGENLAWESGEKNSKAYLSHIEGWYNEVKNFPSSLVDSYDPDNTTHQIGHYAQLINANTFRVGCGRSQWGKENMLVCHFGSTVYRNESLYTRGPPASMCMDGTKSSYEGLCALGSRSSISTVLMSSLLCLSFTVVYFRFLVL